ncbi:hypothetical protein ACFY7C_17765 [Streptomyces sp. NPDC012769]|uniref:hypothetical protein n=1 Tax=Streptomyces sp. NPDC012769 TaxID=3364848 RepID=UPI0036A8AB97
MNPLPPSSGPPPLPDPRMRDVVPDHEGMRVLVAELALPSAGSMYVTSALDTCRELVRHSFFRYEFATVAVTHSLVALEHVLVERLAVDAPLRELIERAVDAGLIDAGLAAELDRCRLLRERLARGAATSAAVGPEKAVAMLRTVFDAVALLLREPPEGAERAVGPADGPSEDRLAHLWDVHRRASFPASFRGVDIEGVELVLLDADVAGLVQRELHGGLDDRGVALLWKCVADLDKILPLIDEEYCGSYYARLRAMAGLAAARSVPSAT